MLMYLPQTRHRGLQVQLCIKPSYCHAFIPGSASCQTPQTPASHCPAPVIVLAAVFAGRPTRPLPDVRASSAQVVLARDGQPLWRFADDEGVWRYPVTLGEVSPFYLQALLDYEDRWFYQHPGINPFALLRAAWLNLRHDRIVSGGSTLSMQVARIIEPHSRTFQGKLRQIWRTLQLEWHYSKDAILEIYLNRAPFGGTLEGVSAASWAYLSKPASELTPAEAALLAVLPQAPSRLRPDRHPLRAQAARDKLLHRLHQHKTWPTQQIDEALAEAIWLAPRQEPALAPLLARRLRQPHGGRIQTTLDFALQQRLELLLASWKHRLPPRVSAAIVVAETASLEVRAYLGSTDLHDEQRSGHVDMVQAVRSPGSTLKPFLYALALEDGLIHSESLLQDVPRHHASYQPATLPAVLHRCRPARPCSIHSTCQRYNYLNTTAANALMPVCNKLASACNIRTMAFPTWH